MNSLISIIIPTYNRAHLICETLDSIVNQSYTNWECIIVDDGSTDNTTQILAGYCKKDKRFQYHKRPLNRTKGANACRNFGYELSKGKYIKWFDSDDIMKPKFLETQHNFLSKNPEFDFCASQWEYFFLNGTTKRNKVKLSTDKLPVYSYLLESHIFATPAPLWKKIFLKDKELFDEKLKRSQEADFHFRMLLEQPKYKILRDFLFSVRRGHDSIEQKSNSTEAQLSVHYYFEKAFKFLIKKVDKSKDREKLEKYLLFRIFNQKYIVLSKKNNLKERLKYFMLFKNFMSYSNYLSKKDFSKVFLGFFLMLFFKRGFNLLVLKKYDIR